MKRAARIAARMASRFGTAVLRTLKRLAPDTWIKRCIYAGLVLAAGVFLVLGTWQVVVTWLVVPAIALLAAGTFYYSWKAFAWLRDHLLWKVRNRIIVVFLFAGIAPLCIASSISILVGWLWIGTLGTNLVTRHIEENRRPARSYTGRYATGPAEGGFGRQIVFCPGSWTRFFGTIPTLPACRSAYSRMAARCMHRPRSIRPNPSRTGCSGKTISPKSYSTACPTASPRCPFAPAPR